MIRFIYFSNWFEKSLENAKDIYEQVNKMDVANGGEDYDYEQTFKCINSYPAQQSVEHGQYFNECFMPEFIHNLQDTLYSFSNIADKLSVTTIAKKPFSPFAIFKTNIKNYGKQKMLIEIANTICKEKFEIELIKLE